MKREYRYILCAGPCGKKFRVGAGVAWITCGSCMRNMAEVWDRNRKKKGAR